MTQLTDYLNQGYQVMVSPMIEPDTVFAWNEPESQAAIVMHPLNYNYAAYENPFEAHALNMEWIQEHVIDRMAAEALRRLDEMVDEFNRKNEPQIITFFYGTEVTENEDGSFSFAVKGIPFEEDSEEARNIERWTGYSYEEQRALHAEYQHRQTIDEGYVLAPGQKYTTYQELKNRLGREPNFDELIRGY